ncbi:MAG: DUF1573 domain-containing protein [Candidatus Limisoma sp.]
MKRIAKLIICSVLVAMPFIGIADEPETDNGPKIVFEEMSLDLGKFDRDSVQVATFRFRNEGTAPLVIDAITGGCRCTSARNWTRDSVAPGDTGFIDVSYSGFRQPSGDFRRAVTVRTNAVNFKNGVARIFITGHVNRDDNEPNITF